MVNNMELSTFFPKIVIEFEKWYSTDEHSKNINAYKKFMTKEYIESLSNNDFIDFFYKFVEDGGMVQSGGDRTKNLFKKFIVNNIQLFKSFILEPFNENFNFEDWFKRIENYDFFGIGVATIYLNRINNKKYSILNNKSLKAIKKLGYNISSTKNVANYKIVNKIQKKWISTYPSIDNLYKADALNHFLIGTEKGKQLLRDFEYKKIIDDNSEQDEIIEDIESEIEQLDENKLLQMIIDNEKINQEIIEINSKKYKRHNYLMVLIKKYRNYMCQFCSTTILKESGDYYIEACHIKSKSDGGKDTLNNILVLCPNCHKLFDYAKREPVKHIVDEYIVKLNGTEYKASLT